jgi:hypothetical protein
MAENWNFPSKSLWKSPIYNLNNVCEMVYETQRNVQVWLYTG